MLLGVEKSQILTARSILIRCLFLAEAIYLLVGNIITLAEVHLRLAADAIDEITSVWSFRDG